MALGLTGARAARGLVCARPQASVPPSQLRSWRTARLGKRRRTSCASLRSVWRCTGALVLAGRSCAGWSLRARVLPCEVLRRRPPHCFLQLLFLGAASRAAAAWLHGRTLIARAVVLHDRGVPVCPLRRLLRRHAAAGGDGVCRGLLRLHPAARRARAAPQVRLHLLLA